jgi:hypothetical protein
LQLYHFFTINLPILHGSDFSSAVSPSVTSQLAHGGFVMNRKFTIRIMVLAFLSACLLTATASAACGDANKLGGNLHQQSWQGADPLQPGSLLTIADDSDPIVGMWHVTFTAQGNDNGPPDGTPIDNSLVTWHSDGTELMNSARPPQDGDFCMGVWKRTGRFKYKLNHFAWFANDTVGAPSGIGNPTGPTRILQQITLSQDGKHYSGTFTLDAYDTSGAQVAHIVGVIAATRITINTTVPDLL